MRIKFMLPVMIFLLSQCKDEPKENIPEIKYGKICDRGPEVQVDTVFKDMIGTIKWNAPFYLIEIPVTKYTSGGIVGPCDSLTAEFRNDGMKVKISGIILSSPATLNTVKFADIIQLISIEEVK
ncbi:hypothetical protein ACFP1I_11980 [Dyadobacter subterraneus]|uniref:Uncharacterized protein n=1 Tax=Dyadobacter subterraneus TaxID=2773304 RepID=A0ABR9WEU0_9BACT|nr:hypothetical protein [Dyadobacter subterraneus]MBE9463644.1 hypothetical protein [Dyadobacter subterraneus]